DLYDNATREILEQKVHIPGYNLRNSIGAQPHVRDLEVHPDSGTKPRLVSDHHNVYLAPQ
ncbi:MAG: ABC transporter substrate-binding protein, partial [Halobacteriota archaeon]